LEIFHLEERERDLDYIYIYREREREREVVRMGREWQWYAIVSSGELRY